MVQHPVRDDAVEAVHRKGQRADVTHLGVDAPLPRQLDHARRDVDGGDTRAQLVPDPLGERSPPAPDLEDACRPHLRDRLERRLTRVGASHSLIDGRARHEPSLARILGANDLGVVEAQGWMIGVPGAPLPGCFAPSHAHTVAPTSPNSPFS